MNPATPQCCVYSEGVFGTSVFSQLKFQRTASAQLGELVLNSPEGINFAKVTAIFVQALRNHGLAFTADILGDTVLSENEGSKFAQQYIALIKQLRLAARTWPTTLRRI